jgi:hypothetical protein
MVHVRFVGFRELHFKPDPPRHSRQRFRLKPKAQQQVHVSSRVPTCGFLSGACDSSWIMVKMASAFPELGLGFDQRWLPKSVLCLRDYNLNKFGHDVIAGVTVGLVALPLAMAFSIAS